MTYLRAKIQSTHIPPPMYTDVSLSHKNEEDEDVSDKPFVCGIRISDSQFCQCRFVSNRALLAHQRRRSLPGHKLVYTPAILTITNACNWCHTLFASTYVAQNHARRSFEKGFCDAGRTKFKHVLNKSTDFECTLCLYKSDRFDEYALHAQSHLPNIYIKRPSEPIAVSACTREKKKVKQTSITALPPLLDKQVTGESQSPNLAQGTAGIAT